MRRRRVMHKRRQLGQVMIETALAAIGIVVLAFLVAKVGMWLNRSLVQRNESFQATRVAAGSTSPGLTFAAPEPIHILGPTADSTGGLPPQPLGPSSIPPNCAAGAALLTHAQQLRADSVTQRAGADVLQKEAHDLADEAADLVVACSPTCQPPTCPPSSYLASCVAPHICSGNQCKGANWFYAMGDWLRDVLEGHTLPWWRTELANATTDLNNATTDLNNATTDLNNANAALAAANADLAAAQATNCGSCTVTTQCNLVEQCDAKGNCTWVNQCVDVTDCTARDACLATKASAISAAQAAVNAAQAAVNAAQAAVNAAQARVDHANDVINKATGICAETGTGNPWVGGAPTCDPTTIQTYANSANNQGHTVMSQVDSRVTQLSTKANTIQGDLLQAEDEEARGRAQCASGRDP